MTDIFHHWKENKFIVAPTYAFDLNDGCVRMVVLTDISFWADSVDELAAWCDKFGCTQKGMTVEFPSEDLLTAFCLRWS